MEVVVRETVLTSAQTQQEVVVFLGTTCISTILILLRNVIHDSLTFNTKIETVFVNSDVTWCPNFRESYMLYKDKIITYERLLEVRRQNNNNYFELDPLNRQDNEVSELITEMLRLKVDMYTQIIRASGNSALYQDSTFLTIKHSLRAFLVEKSTIFMPYFTDPSTYKVVLADFMVDFLSSYSSALTVATPMF